MSIPNAKVTDLNLNPMQAEAMNTIGLIVQGKYEVYGTDPNDDSQAAFVYAEDVKEDGTLGFGKPFRVTPEGMVVPLRANDDDTLSDVEGEPIPAFYFAAVVMSYDTIIVKDENTHPTMNEEFADTASLLARMVHLGFPLEVGIETLRAGMRKEGIIS